MATVTKRRRGSAKWARLAAVYRRQKAEAVRTRRCPSCGATLNAGNPLRDLGPWEPLGCEACR